MKKEGDGSPRAAPADSPASRLAAAGHDAGEIVVRVWTEAEFDASAAEWDALLARSNANPLFMSWPWLHSWWREFGGAVGSSLRIYAGYASSGHLVALAPMHLRRARIRSALSVTRLELLGSSWRDRLGGFSEYLDFIVDPAYASSFFDALASRLRADRVWQDLVLANTLVTSNAGRFLREHSCGTRYLREVDAMTVHKTMLPERFEDYLQRLSAPTRRKAWNHRRKLKDPRLVRCDEDQIEAFFEELDHLHEQRWGRSHFVGLRGKFHRRFARQMAQRGALQMSRLEAGSETLSVLYNVRLNDTEYNIQSGFSPRRGGGLSPGYLHLGLSLAQACAEGVRCYDFLAGPGKTRDYKKDFATEQATLVTLHALRRPLLAFLFKQYDSLK